jgi:hypothetical protein
LVAHGIPRPALTRALIAFALALAAVLAPAARSTSWSAPFGNPHAWVEAHHEIMALDFAREGVLARRLLPVQNFAPHGLRPDAYNHWPPLFPIALRWWNGVFGWSEAAARALMALVLLLGAAGAWRLAAAAGAAGWIAALVWLAVPHQLVFGLKLIHLHAALVAGMWSLALLLEGRPRASAVLAVLATACSWEPVPVLVVALLLAPAGARRAALWPALAALATAAGLMLCYYATRPDLFDGLLDKVTMRTGMLEAASHDSTDHGFGEDGLIARKGSLRASLGIWLRRSWESFGWIPIAALLALPFVLWRAARPLRVACTAWLFAWGAWFLLFQNHATIHVYEMQLGLPLVALATAAALAHPRLPRAAVGAAVALILAQGGVNAGRLAMRGADLPVEDGVALGRELREAVPAGSIVMMPEYSLLPMWYLQRHYFRGVRSPTTLDQALAAYRDNYPERPPLWLAYLPGESDALEPMFADRQPECVSERVRLYRIETD